MKELEKQDKIEIVVEKQEKKEIKLIGTQRKIPGLTLFSCDKDGNIEKVQFKKQVLDLGKPLGVVKHTVVFDENKRYCQALNIKNARKKFL